MKTNDFSAPRRMSKSAFVIFLVNNLWLYAKYFLFIVILELFNSEKKLSFIEAALDFLVVLAICLTLAAVIAFINYYSKKYYVENGNLIFIHGLVRKEITSISLTKIHSLRTKQGLIYRLLDMKGVSFDTLASQSEEIEMILDNEDWEALLSRIETLDSQTQIQASEADKIEEKTDGYTTKLSVGNLNLIKGALCQNHLRGMVVFGSILVTLYDQIISVNENAVEYFYGYMATHADFLRLSLSSCITVAAILYIVTLLLWLGKVFLRYFNMDIRIDREQLFFESGLISRNSSRFSYDKICTVYIKRNIIEKWLACSTVMLKQALNATDRNRGADVRIYGSDSATTFLDWWLGKDYASSQPIVSAQSGYGLLGYTIRFDLLVSLAAGIALCYFQYYGWLWLPVVYILISLIKGIFSVRRRSITLKEDYVEINSGKFAEVKNYFKYSNMEVVRMTATPFTPFYHRVNLVISTNGSSFTVRSLKEQEAKEIYELLLYNCYIK